MAGLSVEGGLEELVRPHVTEETLADLRSQTQHREQPWPQSLDKLQEILIDAELTSLEEGLNRALGRFSIGIGDLSDRYPTVYSVAFLQLYNHLVEGAAVHQCANERCGRAFVRQRGRAEYGQHRTTGVKYCSRECARAQAQRVTTTSIVARDGPAAMCFYSRARCSLLHLWRGRSEPRRDGTCNGCGRHRSGPPQMMEHLDDVCGRWRTDKSILGSASPALPRLTQGHRDGQLSVAGGTPGRHG
jgi:hypothetical protein